MVNRSVINSPIGKIIGGVLFVALLVAWVMWPRRMPAPRDADRVWHPDGYSVIAPPDWKMSIETEEKTLVRTNRGWLKVEPRNPGYYPPTMTITALRDPPETARLKETQHFTEGTFQGKPALIASAPHGKYWAYQTIFQDRDRWFQITLSMPDYADVPNSSWWPYLDSFRYQPEKAKKENQAPATQTTFTFTTSSPATTPAGAGATTR
jgi:hypothetical protein